MTYRFYVVPVSQVDQMHTVENWQDSLRTDINGKPAAELSELLDTLSDSGAGDFVIESAGARGAIIAVDEFEADFLESLLELTMGRGFAIYDEEVKRLYDPRGRVQIRVDIATEVSLPYLGRTLLKDLLEHPKWPQTDAPFFVIARADQEFVQVYCHDDGSCQLEYRDGGPDAHFVFNTSDKELVSDVMWAWTTRDDGWRAAVAWKRLDPSDEEQPEPNASQHIHIDRNREHELTFADTRGEPILAYCADSDEASAHDGRPTPVGWVLRVQHYEPFVLSVKDFDRVDEALARAQSHLSSPLPAASRVVARSAVLQNEHRDDGSWLNIDACLDSDGTLRINGQDLGSVTQSISDDGEYEWFYTIAADDVPKFVVALGGEAGTDAIELLEQCWSGDNAYRLGEAIRSSGVQYRFSCYP